MNPHPLSSESTQSSLVFASTASSLLYSFSLPTSTSTSVPSSTPTTNAGNDLASVKIFNHLIPVWVIATAGAALAILIVLIILLAFFLRRRSRRRRRALTNRPISMESFVAGTPDSSDVEHSVIHITNPRKSRNDRLLQEIALITASPSKEHHPIGISRDLDLESSSSAAGHGTDTSKELLPDQQQWIYQKMNLQSLPYGALS